MYDTVLFVDDEENVLRAIERLFVYSDMRVLTATNAMDALAIMEKEDVSVLVSDNLMPGMRGVELFVHAKASSPDTVRVMMTGYADLATAIDAINNGEVFRFLVKPWDNEQMVSTVEDGVRRHNIVRSLRSADEGTLRSIGQTIELKDHYTKGHCDRVALYSLQIAGLLGLGREEQREIKHGSWLHDCGKIGVPEAILNVDRKLTDDEYGVVKNHPIWGAEVARQANLSRTVVDIILYHHERYDGKGYPHGLKGEGIPLAARVVSVADVFDAITSDRPYSSSHCMDKTVSIMASLKGASLDPHLVDIFLGLVRHGSVRGCGWSS